MRYTIRQIIALLLSISFFHTNDATTLVGTSFFSPRSQATNVARTLVGEHRFEHQYDQCYTAVLSATGEYTSSYRPRRLGQYFFGTNIVEITGSLVPDRSDDQILADYFGLSQTFTSEAHLEPSWSNGLIDFSLFLGYNNWYFTAHAPLVKNNAKFEVDEDVFDDGLTTPYLPCYMGFGAVEPVYASWKRAMQSGKSFGDVQPLRYGKIACNSLSQTKWAAVELAIGYDVVNREDGYAGFNLRLSIPTGTRPNSDFLFTPIVGNGHHWEFGAGFQGRGLIWERNGIQQTYLYFVMNVTHLFKTEQRRSFDFYNNSLNNPFPCPQSGFGSRYILVKEFDENKTYTGTTLPAINVSTLKCKVSAALQCDFAFMISYQHCGFGFDIGYNGYVRSKETIHLNKDQFPNNKYGFKGIQNIDSTSTQSNATLDGNALQIAIAEQQALPAQLTFAEQQAVVVDANPPVFIQANDLNPDSAASPMILTNKIFWLLYYTGQPTCHRHITPYYGIGGEMEFEGDRQLYCRPNKNTMSQWGFWAKTGIAWY